MTNLLVNHFSVLDLVRCRCGRCGDGRNDLVLRSATLRLNTVVGLETMLHHVVLDAEPAAAEVAKERLLT